MFSKIKNSMNFIFHTVLINFCVFYLWCFAIKPFYIYSLAIVPFHNLLQKLWYSIRFLSYILWICFLLSKKYFYDSFSSLAKAVLSILDTSKAAKVDSINTAINIIIIYLLPISIYSPINDDLMYLSIISWKQ